MRALVFAVLISISIFHSLNSRAQVGIAIKCAEGWWASCCICSNCLVVDPPPAMGYCRHCNLLCPKCRKDLGDLQTALEKLKAKNRALKSAYDAYEKGYSEDLENYVKGYEDLYGKEGDWTISGLNSNFGKFAASYAAVMSNATGVTNLAKALSTSLQLYQSSSAGDFAINGSGGLLDVANSQWGMIGITSLIAETHADKLVTQLNNGVPVEKALNDFLKNAQFFPDTPWKLKDVSNAGEFAGLALDLYGFGYSVQDIWDNLGNISESAGNMDIATEQMARISDSIVKNVNIMTCIRETLDSLNSGGLGMTGNANSLMAASNGFSRFSSSTYFAFTASDTILQLDRASIKSALAESDKLRKLTKSMVKRMEKDIIAPLVPWLTQKWSRLKKAQAILLLQKCKKGVQAMQPELNKALAMAKSLEELLKNAVTGYELDYVIGPSTNAGTINEPGEKWKTIPNSKVKAGMGRMAFTFPKGIYWRMEFYKGDKYITNYNSGDTYKFYELEPGTYNIELNYVRVNDVSIANGNETIMKSGVLQIVNNDRWELYTANKKKYLTSGNKPIKMAMIPGTYVVNILDKDYTVTVGDRMTVRFEVPNPLLMDE